MYCYNYMCNDIVSDYLGLNNSSREEGFEPLRNNFTANRVGELTNYDSRIDTFKLNCIKEFIGLTYGMKLIFAMSPYYQKIDKRYTNYVRHIAKESGIPYLDNSGNLDFVYKKGLFADGVHLNQDGANTYTKMFVRQYKRKDINYIHIKK